MIHGNPQVVKVQIVNGKLEVIYRKRSMISYGPGQDKPPDKVYKEIYEAQNGEVILGAKVKGQHIPAKQIPEEFRFPETTHEPRSSSD